MAAAIRGKAEALPAAAPGKPRAWWTETLGVSASSYKLKHPIRRFGTTTVLELGALKDGGDGTWEKSGNPSSCDQKQAFHLNSGQSLTGVR